MSYKNGDIVVVRFPNSETIARIERLTKTEAYCSKAIISVDGQDWKKISDICSDYEGEYVKDIARHVDVDEFDLFHSFYPKL